MDIQLLFYEIFSYSSILRPSGDILAFKILTCHFSALFWIRGTLKRSSGCYKSNFESRKIPQFNLAFSATRAAFLALMTLKLKNKEVREYMTPNDPNDVNKL